MSHLSFSITYDALVLNISLLSRQATISSILPLLPPLVSDAESIIRQHLASQLLPVALTCLFGDDPTFDPNSRGVDRKHNQEGYAISTIKITSHMKKLLQDQDIDVRKAASDALATLALFIKPEDVPSTILSAPLKMAQQQDPKSATGATIDPELFDDLCITACNLLADVASIDSKQVPPSTVSKYITPTVVALCKHPNFRVRRAAVQALPRLVSGSSLEDAVENIVPLFAKLGHDETYRVRKSVGECLVDMSRGLMLLPLNLIEKDNLAYRDEVKEATHELRRTSLIPLCCKLLRDSNRAVRHGMMQFLGPFIASFYPLEGHESEAEQYDGVMKIIQNEEAENSVGGLGAQFFPHAHGMVSRLNPETIYEPFTKNSSTSSKITDDGSREYLQSLLPDFLEKYYNDSKSLSKIIHHRDQFVVSPADIEAVAEFLLPPYVELANMSTGDENVDAEMRVYCAYSLPAVILLLGRSAWDPVLKECFIKLLSGNSESSFEANDSPEKASVPLPVKRCLASSFHTICNILGPDIMKASPDDTTAKRDLLSIFELQFLRDTDDTVQLNVIRNLPSFLSLLSASKRSIYLPILFEIINGDTMLASKRKNALNPVLLNWRQRDMIAQILPNLISLYPPDQVRQYLWPIVKTLLSDPVNIIRENIEWSIPILLRCYEVNNCVVGQKDSTTASKFSSDSSHDVFSFLKATLLENHNPVISNGRGPTCGAFSKRQSYCRILSAIALILRVNEKSRRRSQGGRGNGSDSSHQFYSLTSDEYRHLHHLLKQLFLPPAMVMKEDRVTNVRLSLANCLRMMPSDIRDEPSVNIVLRTLEDEIQTWEGGGGQDMDISEGLSKTNVTDVSGNEDNRDSMNLDLGAFSRNEKELLKGRAKSRNEDDSSLASI